MDLNTQSPYIKEQDVRKLFGCGRSKALLIMHAVGTVKVGRTSYVRASDLDRYLSEHDGRIALQWPKRR
jgi:hypothetical protein